MFEFLRRWWTGTSRVRPINTKVRKHRSAPRLEILEERWAPAVFNVNSTADILNSPAGVVTLRSAIEAANATPGGNTINLTVPGTYSITLPGTPGEVDNAAGEFAISAAGGNLTIDNTSGGTVIVNGNHLARVFDINPIFTVGSAVVTAGGSGFKSAPTVTLTGGGGTGATATATIANGKVTSVTITNPGSGYTSAPTITFTGGGGKGAAAVAVVASPKITVTMDGLTIENGDASGGNVPAGAGGGIRDNNNANLTLNNMIITNNFASADGGGISMTDLLNFPWALTINNSTISDNRAGDQGAGVEEDGTGLVRINAGTVITGNTSTNEGAGVYLDAIPEGGVFSVAVTNGGKGFAKAPTVTFTGGGGTGATGTAIISHGKVVGVTITNPGTGYITAPTITFSGGGGMSATATANLTLGTSTLDITGAVITDNVSLDSIGGGVANSGDGVVNISSSTLANNFAGTTGGGFSDENNQGTLNVADSFFLNNTAAGNGGGIFVGSPTTTIANTEIDGNNSGGNGGGIFAGGTTLTIQASTIADNITSGNGGGIEIATTGGGLANGSTITNSTITGNVALNRTVVTTGGGIDASPAFTGALMLLNDTVNDNFAAGGGGVSTANAAGSSVIVEDTIVAGNFLDNLGSGTDAAGAFVDNGGNLIGISGPGSGNTGFAASTTQTGTSAKPLNPLLGPLQNNGGATVGAAGDSMTLQTEALEVGSPAINKGLAGAPTVDERGFVRDGAASNAAPDIGAFQFENTSLAVSVSPSAAAIPVNGSVTFTITVTNTSANALPDDDSLVTVTLPPNLTLTASPAGATVSGNTVTFRLGAVAAEGAVMFTLTATANATGTATVSASVTSPDANPNTASSTGSVTLA
jgi:Domain of unknown function DUF11